MDFSDVLFPSSDMFPDEDAASPEGPDVDQHGLRPNVDGGSFDMFDIDDDGYAETRVDHTEEGMTISTDQDVDGVIDTFTAVGRDGHYETWDIFRAADGAARWERTSSGDVFD